MRHAALLTAILVPLVAGAADAPKRKSGLWDVTMTSPQMGNRAVRFQECVDEKNDEMLKMDELSDEETKCGKANVRNEGGRLVIDAVCKTANSTVRARTVFSGSFDSAYKADVKATYDPPLEGLREATQVFEGKWLGPCQPGQKPGDVVIPGMPNTPADIKGMPKK